MVIHEESGDLFAVDSTFFLAHCISADAKMGAGIAKRFVREFPELAMLRFMTLQVGQAYLMGRVFNLVTKPMYFDKPTCKILGHSLDSLAGFCAIHGVGKLAMPRIGCGLDRLSWTEVAPMIEKRFKDLPVDIEIRFL